MTNLLLKETEERKKNDLTWISMNLSELINMYPPQITT